MKKYLPILKKTQLFSGVGEEEIEAMLGCLQAELKYYKKGAYIFRQGERNGCICLLVEGDLHIQRDDYWGNRTLISYLTVGDMFGESYAIPGSGPMQSDVFAASDSVVIRMDVTRLLTSCSSACRFHTMVIENLFYAISEKNRRLLMKLEHLSRRTTREKLLSYLSEEAQRQRSGSFTIPLNRQQLADYLSVDRSAMTTELSRLRDEGLLTYDKNHFTLL